MDRLDQIRARSRHEIEARAGEQWPNPMGFGPLAAPS